MTPRLEAAIEEVVAAAEAVGESTLRARRSLDARADPILSLLALARRDRHEAERTAAVKAAHVRNRARLRR